MKIWLDDVRPAPDDTWMVVKNWEETLNLFLSLTKSPEIMSFDHDLGLDNSTGQEIMKYLQSLFSYIYPLQTLVHSMNPVGAENMRMLDINFRKHVLGG